MCWAALVFAGSGDGRRGAVIIDTVGATAASTASVTAYASAPWPAATADPLAANYVPGSTST